MSGLTLLAIYEIMQPTTNNRKNETMNTTEESPNRYNELSPERRHAADQIINSMASYPYVTWDNVYNCPKNPVRLDEWYDRPRGEAGDQLVWELRFNVGR